MGIIGTLMIMYFDRNSGVIYGKIAANAVRTNELMIDADVQFKPGATYNKILGCDAIYHKSSATGYDTESYVALFNNQISISAGTGGNTYLKGPGLLSLTSSGGKVSIGSGSGNDIELNSADDIVLNVADAASPLTIKDWQETGNVATYADKGWIKFYTGTSYRYIRLFSSVS